MGLFSSKHTFTAYVGSSSLLDEDSRNSTVKGLMLQSAITEETTMAEAVKLGLQIDLYARARSMLRYAKRDEGYVYGLPDSSHPGHGDYLPIVSLMQDRVWFDETEQPELELTTKRILKRLALDADEVKEEYILSVEEGIESGDRPGTDQLDDWDFFIQFAAPMHTRTRGTREYIHHFLSYLGGGNRSWSYRQDYEDFINGGEVGDQPTSNFHLAEGEGSNSNWQSIGTGYQSFYAWSYIEEVEYQGEYTPPGWDEPLRPNHCYSKVYKRSDSDYAEGLEEVHGEGVTLAPSAGSPDTSYHAYAVFTQQGIDGSYIQVLIMAPSMMYIINTPSDDSPEADDFQYIDVPLFPEDPEEDSEFRWPIRVENLKETATMHREEMLQEALCATVFLVEHVKVKFYQKTFFKWLIIIIIIIILIIAQQYHLLAAVKELAVAAFALGATATALAFAALYVAMVFAIGFMISFAGSLIGGRAGQLFVIAATLYMAGANPFQNISNTWGNLAAAPGFGTAMSFIQAVNPIFAVANVGYSAYQTDKLEGEMKDFIETARDKYDMLRDAYDMMGPMPAGLDPIFITSIFTGHYPESPESFYDRTLNANPGILGYDLISDFSAIALELPEDDSDTNVIDSVMNSFARQRGAA